eukprot:scaffold4807_cov222-Chaetoceros_neogracile.AAC.3
MLCFLTILITSLSITRIHSFPILLNDIKASIFASSSKDSDATTIPSTIFSSEQQLSEIPLSCLSEFCPTKSRPPLSFQDYEDCAVSRHKDCRDLFDSYNTKVIRCEQLSSGDAVSKSKELVTRDFMIRWEASWIMMGSVWIYKLADIVGWQISKKAPDPSRISTFSWRNVFRLFGSAFQTGVITLPVSRVEGSTRLRISTLDTNNSSSIIRVSISESIDLIREGDLGRLQNRKVAQELAAWLDVSRRPEEISEETWAGIIRSRVLSGVPGAGVLDVDPNEDDESVFAVFTFGVAYLIALSISYNLLLGEAGSGQVSKLCDDAPIIEVGAGYLSECFGLDGPFIK